MGDRSKESWAKDCWFGQGGVAKNGEGTFLLSIEVTGSCLQQKVGTAGEPLFEARSVDIHEALRICEERHVTEGSYCADCLRPTRDSMHGAPSERWRAPVLVRVDGAQAIRRCSSQKVRDEDWVVTAPDGQVYSEEFGSWVDAAPVTCSGNHRWRLLAFQGADEAARERLFSRPRAIAHQDQAAGREPGRDHDRFFDAFGAPMTVIF